METRHIVLTDLGLIRVESLGKRDVVIISHNNLTAFAVTCSEGTASRVKLNKEFLRMDQQRVDEVIKEYSHWKRTTLPEFVLPKHSGLTKDGRKHPWRKRRVPQ